MSVPTPSEETLRQQLQIEWQDHIQTRTQTWKTLEIEGALVLGFVGVDIRFNNPGITLILGVLVLISTLSGIAISIHHREGQVRKFTHIHRLEEVLGLHRPGLLDSVHPPVPFKWIDVFNPKRINTPVFILRSHLAILLFTMIYMVVRTVMP